MYTKNPKFSSLIIIARAAASARFFSSSPYYGISYIVIIIIVLYLFFFFTPSDCPNNSFSPNIDTRVVGNMTINSSVFILYSIYTYNIRYFIYFFSLVFSRFRQSNRRIAYDCSVLLVWPVGFHISLINYRRLYRQQQSLHLHTASNY